MARFVDAIDLPIPVEEAFDYLADFSRTAEWDPSVSEARRIGRGPIGEGSRFEVTVSFLGQPVSLEYRITQFERPHRLVLEGGDENLESIDEITFVERKGGTRLTYEARVELQGLRRLADPILDVLFQRVGRLAARGLRERLVEESAHSEPRTARRSQANPKRSKRTHSARQKKVSKGVVA